MPFSDLENPISLIYTCSNAPIRPYKLEITSTPPKGFYAVKRIIFNDPATIVFWEDGTKTVVKVTKGDKYNKYFGFLAALAKKVYGSNTEVQKIIEKKGEETPAKDTFDSPEILKALDRWLAKEKQAKERQEK